MGEDVADVLSRHRGSILQVQVADQGYDGWVGLEYLPGDPADSATSFGWL
jgi:hydroxypyruvate isomerase